MQALSTTAVTTQPIDVQQAVQALYVQHARGLYLALRRLTWPSCDVDDLLQDVFVIALRRGATLMATDSPGGWLYGVALSIAASAGRKHRLREFLGMEASREPQPTLNGTDALELREREVAVHRALARLSARKREVLVLFELQGLTGPEIARALGCSEGTVWTRLHYARRDFEKQLVRHG